MLELIEIQIIEINKMNSKNLKSIFKNQKIFIIIEDHLDMKIK